MFTDRLLPDKKQFTIDLQGLEVRPKTSPELTSECNLHGHAYTQEVPRYQLRHPEPKEARRCTFLRQPSSFSTPEMYFRKPLAHGPLVYIDDKVHSDLHMSRDQCGDISGTFLDREPSGPKYAAADPGQRPRCQGFPSARRPQAFESYDSSHDYEITDHFLRLSASAAVHGRRAGSSVNDSQALRTSQRDTATRDLLQTGSTAFARHEEQPEYSATVRARPPASYRSNYDCQSDHLIDSEQGLDAFDLDLLRPTRPSSTSTRQHSTFTKHTNEYLANHKSAVGPGPQLCRSAGLPTEELEVFVPNTVPHKQEVERSWLPAQGDHFNPFKKHFFLP